MTDTQIVNAIQARIDGRFDDPDLMLVGALHDRMGDIVEILSHRAGIIPHDPQDDEPDDDESNRMDTDEPTASDRGTARAIIAEMEQLPRPQDAPGYFDRTGPDGQYPART